MLTFCGEAPLPTSHVVVELADNFSCPVNTDDSDLSLTQLAIMNSPEITTVVIPTNKRTLRSLRVRLQHPKTEGCQDIVPDGLIVMRRQIFFFLCDKVASLSVGLFFGICL